MKRVDGEQYFMPYAEALLAKLGLEEIVSAIDGSIIGRGFNIDETIKFNG